MESNMKTHKKTIIIHLCTQALIGGLFMIPVLLDGIVFLTGGLIVSLIVVALTSVFSAQLLLSRVTPYPAEGLKRGVVWGFFMWFLIVPGLITATEVLSEHYNQRKTNGSLKRESLHAIKQMGLTNFTWDADINKYRIDFKSGAQHTFYTLNDEMHISFKLHVPDCSDTLAPCDTLTWLRSTLHEVSPYLTNTTYKILDSSVLIGNYKFQSGPTGLSWSIFSEKKENEKVWISGETCFNWHFWGNICIKTPFEKRQ